MSLAGPSRHLAAMQPFSGFRTEVDIEPRSRNWLYGYMSLVLTASMMRTSIAQSLLAAPQRSPKSFQFKRKAEQCE